MARTPRSDVQSLFALLRTVDDSPDLEEKLALWETFRGQASGDAVRQLDRMLLRDRALAHHSLRRARAAQEELREILEKMSATPWHPALLQRLVETPLGTRAWVQHGGAARVVGFAPEVEPGDLAIGDRVFLSHDLNLVMAKAPDGVAQCGETASFERALPDGRLVVRFRDEEVIVEPASALAGACLSRGDPVRWDRAARMAFERLEAHEGRQYLLEDVPDLSTACVGGQSESLETLLFALTGALLDPDAARDYGFDGQSSILLYGPPGNGKTLMARVAAAEIQRRSGRRCRFGVVRPGEFQTPWVGETEANIRNCFRALRDEAARSDLAVVFIDEIEAVGRIRGHAGAHHADRFLAALLAELDGFAGRGNVAVISATNRHDLLDPALLQRLSEAQIPVGRPDLHGARDIFEVHLKEAFPYDPNGASAQDTRREMIELAVSTLYAPNAPENILCRLGFRDGRSREVAARELLSGRLIRQICRSACQAAYRRQVGGGARGLQVGDMADAVSTTVEHLASTLTVYNAHAYLDDLPTDVDVVRVDRIERRVRRAHRYLEVE